MDVGRAAEARAGPGIAGFVARWGALIHLLAALLIVASVAALLLEQHDDEGECKVFQTYFRRSLARNYRESNLPPSEALILAYQRTWRFRPPGCPAPVPLPK